MSEIRNFLNQSSQYLIGRIMLMAAGFVSFPILTRILSVSEYGFLGLANTTIYLVMGISKLGLQQSIIRFYSEFECRNEEETFFSSQFISSGLLAISAGSLFYLFSCLLRDYFKDDFTNLLFLITLLIIMQSLITTLMSFVRARQKTKLYNLIMVMTRYSSLTLSILVVIYYAHNLKGYFAGQIAASMMILTILLYIFRKESLLQFRLFSMKLIRESVLFGFPLALAELGHIVLNYSDRYLIQFYLDAASLGIYTAGYNLATYVFEAIGYTISYARAPIAMQILANNGEEAYKDFMGKSFSILLLLLFPATIGFIAIGREITTLLASEKFSEAYTVLPYIIVGQAIYACSMTLNAGLFVRKKTYILTVVITLAFCLNIGMNIYMIPKFNIIGAALSTLICNLIFTVVVTYFAFRELSFKIDYKGALLSFSAAAIMYFAIYPIHLEYRIGNLLIKIVAGVLIYSVVILILDSKARSFVSNIVSGKLKSI